MEFSKDGRSSSRCRTYQEKHNDDMKFDFDKRICDMKFTKHTNSYFDNQNEYYEKYKNLSIHALDFIYQKCNSHAECVAIAKLKNNQEQNNRQ